MKSRRLMLASLSACSTSAAKPMRPRTCRMHAASQAGRIVVRLPAYGDGAPRSGQRLPHFESPGITCRLAWTGTFLRVADVRVGSIAPFRAHRHRGCLPPTTGPKRPRVGYSESGQVRTFRRLRLNLETGL